MRKVALWLAVLALGCLGAGEWRYYEANKDFTPWMSHSELDKFMSQFDTNPPGQHPNYWDNGHWINAVEARWRGGIPQYRIRYGPTPQGYSCGWYWYINQDQKSFSDHVHTFADDGMTLLDPNSYLRPDDTRRYQGVWHIMRPVEPKSSGAPSQPIAQSNHLAATSGD
jgi:hypothetical protein